MEDGSLKSSSKWGGGAQAGWPWQQGHLCRGDLRVGICSSVTDNRVGWHSGYLEHPATKGALPIGCRATRVSLAAKMRPGHVLASGRDCLAGCGAGGDPGAVAGAEC